MRARLTFPLGFLSLSFGGVIYYYGFAILFYCRTTVAHGPYQLQREIHVKRTWLSHYSSAKRMFVNRRMFSSISGIQELIEDQFWSSICAIGYARKRDCRPKTIKITIFLSYWTMTPLLNDLTDSSWSWFLVLVQVQGWSQDKIRFRFWWRLWFWSGCVSQSWCRAAELYTLLSSSRTHWHNTDKTTSVL